MTWDELYPNAPVEFEPVGTDVVRVSVTAPCWHCLRPTAWAELNFQAHLCSPECADAKWQEYLAACHKPPIGETS